MTNCKNCGHSEAEHIGNVGGCHVKVLGMADDINIIGGGIAMRMKYCECRKFEP